MATSVQNSTTIISSVPPEATRLPVASSVLGALVYADLFDAPMSLDDLHRYQVATRYPAELIERALADDPLLTAHVTRTGDAFSLRGREQVFDLSRQRAAASRKVWSRAARYNRWLRRLPFVRMVAVTGALAVNNVSGRHDIDLLVISEPRRVWLCRRGIIACVRLGRLLGDDLCPNYILSESSLELAQRDFFTAHELAQMVPVFGTSLYRRIIEANRWASSYLPASIPAPTAPYQSAEVHPRNGLAERVLRRSTFDGWERWELERLRRKVYTVAGESAEVVMTAEQCKGHTGLHRAGIMTRYTTRLAEFGLNEVIAALDETASKASQS